MAEKEVVLKRDELVQLLAERLEEPSEIAEYLMFIESAFVLQNDAHRPAYLFEVDRTPTKQEMQYISDIMATMGCVACVIPSKMLRYAGTVTPDSIGMESKKDVD